MAIIKYLPEPATINPQLVLLKNIKCNPYYLFFYLTSHCFQSTILNLSGVGSVPNISQQKLRAIPIPIPPLEEQERIDGILDRFETLAHSITEGLPRELELRRKQYSYYRDLLLTFPHQD